MAFLTGAAERPHHAYVFAGPEGSGKSIAARAFVAALLCPEGGCGVCRACRLVLEDHHPNVFLVEPEGRDIHVDTIREEVWTPGVPHGPRAGSQGVRDPRGRSPVARRGGHAPQGARGAAGRFRVVADVGPCARVAGHGAVPVPRRHVHGPVRSRSSSMCSSEKASTRRALGWRRDSPAGTSAARGAWPPRSTVCGSGRPPSEAVSLAAEGTTGALEAADVVLAAAAEYKKGLKAELETALAPFVDEKGRPEDAYRGAIKRIEIRFHRRERRAERDYIDWELLAVSSLLRDRIAGAIGGGSRALHEPRPGAGRSVERGPRRPRTRGDRASPGGSGGGSQPQPASPARARVPASGRARRVAPRLQHNGQTQQKVVLALLAFDHVGWDASRREPMTVRVLDRR